jgi:membrane protein required for colicin V production
MHPYDILMLIILASTLIFGAIKGFAWQVASLASIVVSYVVASYFRHDVAKWINAQPPWNMFLAMLLLYFGTSLAIWMLFRLISSSIDKIRLKEFDRQLGAGFGLLKGAALCCIVTMFAMTLLGPNQKTAIAKSKSGHYIAQALAQAGSIMPDEVKQVIGPYIDNVERELEQGRLANDTEPNQSYLPNQNYPPNQSYQTNQGYPTSQGFPQQPNNGLPTVGSGNNANDPIAAGTSILDRFFNKNSNTTSSQPQPQAQPQFQPPPANTTPPPSQPLLPPLPF